MNKEMLNEMKPETKDIAEAVIEAMKNKGFGEVEIEMKIYPSGYLTNAVGQIRPKVEKIRMVGNPKEIIITEYAFGEQD